MKDTDVLSHDFNEEIEIEGVGGSGIKIEGYFIPCYNSQNGYYGNDLFIEISSEGTKKKIDITSFDEGTIKGLINDQNIHQRRSSSYCG